MAPGMKYWMTATATGMAAVLALTLPLSDRLPFERERTERVDPAADRSRRLSAELSRLNEQLKRLRWTDSLAALMVEADARGEPVAVGMPQLPSAIRVAIESAASDTRAEAAGLPRRDSETLVGAFWIPSDFGGHPAVRERPFSSHEVFVGTVSGRPYCLVAHVLMRREDELRWSPAPASFRIPGEELGGASPLGPCYYWAVYGEPGAGIHAWLRAGAVGFAEMRTVPDPWVESIEPRGLFGIGWWSYRDPAMEACAGGGKGTCAVLFTDGDVLATRAYLDPALDRAVPEYMSSSRRPRYSSALLAELEAEFGHESFAEFWKSSESPEQAFADAFGSPPELWLRRWAQRHLGELTLGARVDLGTVGYLVAVILATAVISAGVAMRRRVA